MEGENDNFDSSRFEALRRYVPLAAWAVAIFTILIIPLRVTQYGYLPGDDALRHAAKAVSDKSWPEILVLNDSYKMDHEFGWNLLLKKIHRWTNWDAEKLVLFSVIGLFVLLGWSAMACLKRPEAWLAAFVPVALVSDLTQRFLLGRPFVLTIAALTVILLLWQRHGSSPPNWRNVFWMTPLVAFAVFFHGVWYLWVLPLAAFFLAQQFRWFFLLGASWIGGTILGSALTGHPVESILQSIHLALDAIGKHTTQNTLVSELRPSGGEIFTFILVGGLIVMRQLAGLAAPPLSRHPAFWLVAMGWVLGCENSRFWEDWGAPALVVLIATDLQLLFELRFPADSFKRLALACVLAAACLATTTTDVNSRWSSTLTTQFLSESEHPEIKGWMPDKGGIFYSADMSLFYQTFFKNPDADWRYALGFESTLMTDENFEVYHKALWNFGDAKAYKPWVDKIQPQDRLVIRGGANSPPNIPQLEWNYGVSGIWLGRLPRNDTNGAPATVPAAVR